MASSYRLGFLLCDHALEHLAARFGDYPAMFADAFAAVSDCIEWQVYDVTRGELPPPGAALDGYMISGSRHGAYDGLPWIAPLEACIRRLAGGPQPLVGLCFGHQIMGQALGGEVRRAAQGWGIGLRSYEVLTSTAWMQPARTRFTVPVCHQDQVVTLPPGARRLARSDHCENFVVEFAPRAIGIQGHPEFALPFLAALIDWRHEVLPLATLSAARESLTSAHDSLALRRWIAGFLGIPQSHPSQAE